MSKPANPALRRRILELALEELAEKPSESINMRELAAKAGVSATAIYYYFPSKDALFEEIKFGAMDELDARVAAALEACQAAGLRPRILALMRAFVAWCREKPHLARLWMESLPPRQDLDEAMMRRYYSLNDRARALLDEAVASGELAARDFDLDIALAQAALWGIVSQQRAKRLHPRFWESADPLVERLADLISAGKGR